MSTKQSLLLLLCGSWLAGCASLNGARPLEPGKHEFAATLGGGMVYFAGAPIPIPNVILEGRSGVAKPLNRPLDINYGINAFPLAFGILQVHLGTSWLLVHQNGGIPALSMTNRIWFASNFFGAGYKAEGGVGVWANHQLEFAVSWEIRHQLIYFALAQYTDFTNPSLTLTPAIGAHFDPGKPGGFRMSVEVRWYGLTQKQAAYPFTFFPNALGSLGISFGFSYAI